MDEDLYHQRTLSETAFSLLKDDGEVTLSELARPVPRAHAQSCIVYLSQAAS